MRLPMVDVKNDFYKLEHNCKYMSSVFFYVVFATGSTCCGAVEVWGNDRRSIDVLLKGKHPSLQVCFL